MIIMGHTTGSAMIHWHSGGRRRPGRAGRLPVTVGRVAGRADSARDSDSAESVELEVTVEQPESEFV
jgi:hypothetical protein